MHLNVADRDSVETGWFLVVVRAAGPDDAFLVRRRGQREDSVRGRLSGCGHSRILSSSRDIVRGLDRSIES
ncbi:hypothetical protein [Microbacterium sp. SCN 70-27]|uniref:hypothetical protein n=1 Tax=Microbacterium sp. SCN 70-27 TaxID=1660114 RepID=UPI002600D365|nr:hypothetical protein [Microbacterium sp. SCN 70-27]